MAGERGRGGLLVSGLLAGALACFALLAASSLTPRADAETCDRIAIRGPGPSVWRLDDLDSGFDEGNLFDRSLDVFRADAFDTYGGIDVNSTRYKNDDGNGCRREQKGREWAYPSVAIGPVRVTPKAYVDPKQPFGRMFYSVRNLTAAPITVDIDLNGDLGSDSDTDVDRTSSGDSTAAANDIWATSCEDIDDDGCANVAGEAIRDPEIAQNWEHPSGSESIDDITFADDDGNVSLDYDDVEIGPGKTVAFMHVVTIGTRIRSVRKAAARIAAKPSKAGVFRGLSKKERKRLVNW